MGKKVFHLALLFVATAVLTTGCLKTRGEVSESEEKRNAQVTVVEQQKADQESKVQDMEATLRQMNGRLEAIEYRLNLDLESRQKEATGSAMTQKQMIEQMKVQDEQIQRLEARLAEVERGPKVNSPPIAVKPTDETTAADKGSTFKRAEEYFDKKEWKSAALTYQEYVTKNPKGKSLADATYKTGICFQELGQKSEAKLFFEEVLEKYPKSQAARKAKFRLDNLK